MAAHELILGGQRSGKSRCAQTRAAAWLARDPQISAHPVVLVATAQNARSACQVVDEHGRLHQAVAAVCVNVTLMVAGSRCR